MKKVLIVCNSLVGLISFRKELLDKLIKESFDVYVVAPNHKYKKDIEKLKCNFIEIEMENRGTNLIKDLKLLNDYKRIIKKINPEVVLTYTIKPNVYAGYICRKLNIPYIANITGLGSAVENPGLLQKITLLLYKIGLKSANCIFFQNKDNLNFMQKHKIIKKNYKLIPGSGVNLKHHKFLTYPNNNLIKFLFISRILHEKGIDEYLEMASCVKKKYPNTEFHILGQCDDANYKQKISELEEKKIIIYHGQVDDIREHQKYSNCTIHPSFYPEGMSNVLLESCAAGRPIITTNRAGCKEIVDDGINGYIINIKDTEDLIKKVETFIKLSQKEKEKMGFNSRKKVEKEFDREIVINAYMNEIKNILKGR